MRLLRLAIPLALLAACAEPDLVPVPVFDQGALSATRFKAVVIAGDPSIMAFDNAADRMTKALTARAGIPPGQIRRLSARPEIVQASGATLATVPAALAAIEALNPAPGEGCLVFATAHGAPVHGLAFPASPSTPFLEPIWLDRALSRGCGKAPTVVIMSGCFSGTYTTGAMARDNRIIITAARSDRTSFGCGADNHYTFFDECLLDTLDRTPQGALWTAAFTGTQSCVTAKEHAMRATPSEPRLWLGRAVAKLQVPWRTAALSSR